jgi:hypothetical protein
MSVRGFAVRDAAITIGGSHQMAKKTKSVKKAAKAAKKMAKKSNTKVDRSDILANSPFSS